MLSDTGTKEVGYIRPAKSHALSVSVTFVFQLTLTRMEVQKSHTESMNAFVIRMHPNIAYMRT